MAGAQGQGLHASTIPWAPRGLPLAAEPVERVANLSKRSDSSPVPIIAVFPRRSASRWRLLLRGAALHDLSRGVSGILSGKVSAKLSGGVSGSGDTLADTPADMLADRIPVSTG